MVHMAEMEVTILMTPVMNGMATLLLLKLDTDYLWMRKFCISKTH